MSSNTRSRFEFFSFRNIFLHLVDLNQDPHKVSTFCSAVRAQSRPLLSLLPLPSLGFSSRRLLVMETLSVVLEGVSLPDSPLCCLVVLRCFSVLRFSYKLKVSCRDSVIFRFSFLGELEILHRWCWVRHIASHQEVRGMFVPYF